MLVAAGDVSWSCGRGFRLGFSCKDALLAGGMVGGLVWVGITEQNFWWSDERHRGLSGFALAWCIKAVMFSCATSGDSSLEEDVVGW